MHPQATNPQIDFDAYVRKVKAGAHGVVTQYFYNADAYFDFVERSERAGLAVPVVPGIMPIVNTAQLLRFSAACGAEIPRWRSEEHTSELQSLMRISFAVFCLKKKNQQRHTPP